MIERMAARCRARTGRRDRGASVVEFAILMPVFLLFMFLLVQAGLYYHAVNVTQAVAQSTSQQLRAFDGTARDPKVLPAGCSLTGDANRLAVEAWQALDANHTAAEPTATACMQGLNQLEVVVQSHSVNLLPGLFPRLDITARSQGPVEVFKDQGTD